eukprot:TRINITY_DN5449_c0_g1_i2.p1 TRINITY_DN5449_c0_g1~~TRINITY_DN5449_c0_g1_i2.p1  ORF type:complete len:134 (-),score=31.38 TRINITY_DN5449_c0_g1_i2:98-499(-)
MASTLVPADPEAGPDKEVTWEDQQKLNTFNRLNAKVRIIAEEIQTKKEQLLQYKDAEGDIMMLMDEPVVRYQVGEVFFHLSDGEATELVSKHTEHVEQLISQLESESENHTSNVSLLKRALYDKFGKQINLDD